MKGTTSMGRTIVLRPRLLGGSLSLALVRRTNHAAQIWRTATTTVADESLKSLQFEKKNDRCNVLSSSPPFFDFETARREILHTWMVEEGQSPRGSQIRARYCCFTHDDVVRAYQQSNARWHWLDRELSSNVAGETGAVHVYKGALAASRYVRPLSEEALEFCHEHQQTEAGHLALFSSLVPSHKHTKLLPLWRVAGWFVGFVPTALAGSRGLYVTVEAIESFVEEHFQEQIQPLEQKFKGGISGINSNALVTTELLKVLKHCCEDEVHHKEEAAAKLLQGEFDYSKVWWATPWRKVVHWGSATAAEIARRI
eukprot:scaffold43394_cov214-Amphora_coffeaeformis.AAC.1